MKINRLITPYNRTVLANKRNMWIVIHYVGAESTARNNAQYFYTAKRNASASYFVDENEIWQVVDDQNGAWHVGGAIQYFNSCRNNNSIGIEMCCKKKNGYWYIEQETIDKTIQLTKYLMQKYNIPIERVCRHYDVTHKICPEPFVRNVNEWHDFLRKLREVELVADIPEVSLQEKEAKIKEFYNLDDNTIKYFEFYRYNTALIDKLYGKAKNG